MQQFIRSKGKTPPGQSVECFNCGKKGHLKSECRLPTKNYTRPHNNRINYKHNNNTTKFGRNGYNNNTKYKQTTPTRRVNLVNSDKSDNNRSFVFSANTESNKIKQFAKIAVFNNKRNINC